VAGHVLVGSFTAANLSGFLHGFVLFCSLPLRAGPAVRRLHQIGGMVAIGLWLYLFHVIRARSATRRLTRAVTRDSDVPPP
jgi:hypothetical protein